MDDVIDIKGLDKAEVLAALYNRARPLGMGMLHFVTGDMPIEDARALIGRGQTRFDYVHGRVMKVAIGGDELDPVLYDHDNGRGAAASVIAKLRNGTL